MARIVRPYQLGVRLSEEEWRGFESLRKKARRNRSDMMRLIIQDALRRDQIRQIIERQKAAANE